MKCPVDEVYCRRSVLWVKWPVSEVSSLVGKVMSIIPVYMCIFSVLQYILNNTLQCTIHYGLWCLTVFLSWYHDAISKVRITRGILAYINSFWMRIFSSSRAWLACSAAATRTSSSLRCFWHDSRLMLWQTVSFCTGTSCFPVSNSSPVCALGMAGRALNFNGNDCENLELQEQQQQKH